MHSLTILLLCFGLTTGAAQPGVTSRGTSGPDVYSTVESVLRGRGFRLPVLLLGTNGDTWLTCDRFKDRSQLDRVLVCIGRSDEVTVQIIPYRFGPSDWPAPRATEFYQCASGDKESEALLAARLWLPGPVQGFGIFPWHLRGTNQVGAAGAEGLRERAFTLVGYALAEESVETEKGVWVQVSGCRYVGDPVSPEGLEATTLGRAIQERLRKRSPAAEGEK